MEDGFYSIYYTGAYGVGMGVLAAKDGVLVGADIGGATYEGQIQSNANTGMETGVIRMTVPAGLPLVTGAQVSGQPYSMEIPISVPATSIAQGPVTLQTPTGPVNVIFKRIRGF